jgi:hypothetical protein
VAPIAIPVVGTPIKGRHLVRAPWAEPLSAFAGVIVETQLVPDEWFRPRAATARAMDPPIPATPISPRPAAAPRPLVAIPIVADRPATTTVPVRVVPVAVGATVASRPAPAPTARPVAVLTSLETQADSIPATSAAPVDPAVPSPVSVAPAPSRRGLLGRAMALTVGLVVSLVAYEAAARLGRR